MPYYIHNPLSRSNKKYINFFSCIGYNSWYCDPKTYVIWMKLAHLMSNLLWTSGGSFCTFTFSSKFLINVHTREKTIYLPYIFNMYTNASNNTPSYTHISSYVVWRVHPLGVRCSGMFGECISYCIKYP
jgi:hypothetical protein